MLLNEASFNDIADKVDTSEICADNFRASIVVNGPNLLPYAEDNWKWIKIGDVVMKNVANCTSCIMSSVNPETGITNNDHDHLKVIKKYVNRYHYISLEVTTKEHIYQTLYLLRYFLLHLQSKN